jgi:hypothetical protein
VTIKLLMPASGAARVERGALAPIAGWVSRAFDRREPTSTIVWYARLTGRSVLRTEIVAGAMRRPDVAPGGLVA